MTQKQSRLLALAKRRQAARWPGYTSIADYGQGVYECEFVSPFTKAACNVNAEVMVLLQDWTSDEELRGGLDDETRTLGYSPTQPTARKLAQLLDQTFGLALSDVYGTNLFPFVKPGAVSRRIPERDLVRAAQEFAIPQIDIVRPRLVICLGLLTFDAMRRAFGLSRSGSMEAAIASPFLANSSRIWCQAHTGAMGQMNRNRGGLDRVTQDWKRMKKHLESV